MGLFSKKDKELDAVANQIQVDISNNYKSSALENIKWLEDLIDEKRASGKLKGKAVGEYHDLLNNYKQIVNNMKREKFARI